MATSTPHGRATPTLAIAGWTSAVLGALVTFLLAGAPGAWQAASHGPGSASTRELVAAGPVVDAPPAPVSRAPTSVGEPHRLLIPRINLDAAVEPVGVDAAGRMGTPTNIQNAGWYRYGARPGDAGDAVLDGHLDWYSGPAVFGDLHTVAAGDEITVVSAAGRATFRVDGVSVHRYTDTVPGLFTTEGAATLSLITCTGGWDARLQTYLERLVVHAQLVAMTPNV